MTNYFSDRELGPRPQSETELTPQVWGGIVAMVTGLVSSGAFGDKFPETCPDGPAVCGVDESSLGAAVRAHIPGIAWPLQMPVETTNSFLDVLDDQVPPTLLALDLTEFVWRNVAKPIQGMHHGFFQHYHLTFDVDAGREAFREQLNLIFARNGMAYLMTPYGQIVRVLPAVIADELRRPMLATGDQLLDVMLEEARVKFTAPDPLIRREALERLWDSFERLKTLAHPTDKKKSITKILENSSSEPVFLALLDDEAKRLTDIGNSHLIRHHEIKQTPVVDVDHVDYLFHRLFALIQLLVRKNAPRQGV